ncbi:MAG: SDR family NAD(P)-dependent oxidoreductase [Spirochaetales bacterium]|nr:SDR family NAD(P)-dependent oxidoreductase [Spirochaetales bacterium]
MKYRYLLQYRFSNIFNMFKNIKKDPEICTQTFENKLVVITGSTTGIGFVTAARYAKSGARLIFINRNLEKTEKQCKDFKNLYNCECTYFIADFTNLEEIHNAGNFLANLHENIDVLIHNSGVFMTKRTFTQDNIELVFQVNYLGSFIINEYIKEKFKKQNLGRIIYVNSEGHRFAVLGVHTRDLDWKYHLYTGLKSYGSAKTAQLLSMLYYKEYFQGSNVTINAMHPGNVRTNMGNNNGKFYKLKKSLMVDRSAKDPNISAEALYFLGVSDKVAGITGKFFNLTTLEIPAPPAIDVKAVQEIIDLSRKLGRV